MTEAYAEERQQELIAEQKEFDKYKSLQELNKAYRHLENAITQAQGLISEELEEEMNDILDEFIHFQIKLEEL